MVRVPLLILLAAGLASCAPTAPSDRPETALAFPSPDRPVSDLGGNSFSTETARDNRGEAEAVMGFADVTEAMSVADIGAGDGYYTVRLAKRVGAGGRVLAQDIDGKALQRLAQRVERQRFDNVSIKPGAADDPRLPEDSFDRIFLVHMYHEVTEPYAFLWRMWPALREGGSIVVVDVDRPTDRHGIDPMLLTCEFKQVGYELQTYYDTPELAGYYAQFVRAEKRPEPADIEPCRGITNTSTPR